MHILILVYHVHKRVLSRKLQQSTRPVSDKAVDNVASVDVDDQHRVELGSVVLRQLRANLYDTVQSAVQLSRKLSFKLHLSYDHIDTQIEINFGC